MRSASDNSDLTCASTSPTLRTRKVLEWISCRMKNPVCEREEIPERRLDLNPDFFIYVLLQKMRNCPRLNGKGDDDAAQNR